MKGNYTRRDKLGQSASFYGCYAYTTLDGGEWPEEF
jgi:hypothetical protein